jgi:hypothetical protein
VETLTETNASGDYIRNLKLGGGSSGPAIVQSSHDRMADFFHTLQGAEGTIRNWRARTRDSKITVVNALLRPEKSKDISTSEHEIAMRNWRLSLLGFLFMELIEPGGDPMVAQALLDSLRDEKVGKR